MFGWRKPKCPVDTDVGIWIEERMNWLVAQFGWEHFAQMEVILPLEAHFPAPFDGTKEAVRGLFEQVCVYMEIDPQTVELKFYSEGRTPFTRVQLVGEKAGGTAGLYNQHEGRTTIWLETSNLTDPTRVVATCAHELCHAHLLGGKRLSPDEPDHEAVTDLATICFGMGVFTANASLRDRTTRYGNWESWQISRLGYLTDPVLGYALALYAWARDERRPEWERHVRADIRALLRQSLLYLEDRDEEVVHPPAPGPTDVGPYSQELIDKLFWKNKSGVEEKSAKAHAAHDAAHSTADELFTQAVFLMQQREWTKAIELLAELLCQDPEDGEVYQQRALALLALGDVHGSLADAEKGVEYAPDDSESYYVRGRAYLESHQHDNAIADFTHYLAAEDNEGTNPGRIGYAYYYRGLARAQMNDFTSAVADFSRALRCHPKLAMAYQARAVAHDALGAVSKAQADREMAERLDREDRGS